MSIDEKRNRITKEVALLLTPFLAAFLFISFYEAGYCSFFKIPIEVISIDITQVLLTNRLTLIAAVVAFLWIALYYNVLPSAKSPVFKGVITIFLLCSLWLGFRFGYQDASQKTEFLVTEQNGQKLVVLKIYDEMAVLTYFQPNQPAVNGPILFKNIHDVQATWQNIGPLGIR